MRSQVVQLIQVAITNLEQGLELPDIEFSEEMVLFGRDSRIDSMALVTLIVDLEELLSENMDVSLTLADDRALSQENSPFRTVGSLADYICIRLQERKQGVRA